MVLSTYRDEKEREGGESVDIVSCDRNYHFVLVRKRVRFFRETTGSSKVALEKYILISNQAIRKSRQVNHYLRYATLKS